MCHFVSALLFLSVQFYIDSTIFFGEFTCDTRFSISFFFVIHISSRVRYYFSLSKVLGLVWKVWNRHTRCVVLLSLSLSPCVPSLCPPPPRALCQFSPRSYVCICCTQIMDQFYTGSMAGWLLLLLLLLRHPLSLSWTVYVHRTHTHTIRYNGPSSSSSSFFFFRLFFLLLVSFFSFLLMCLVFLQCLEEGEREKRKTLPSNCVCVGALLLYTVKQQYDVSRFAETLRHTTTIRRGQYYFHWKADFNQMPCLKKSIF